MNAAGDAQGTWIDRDERLAEFLERTAAAPWLALDTEFLRERTYYPQLCLLQVSDGARHALVDVQAELDPAPLLARLREPGRACALHACLQDAEALDHRYGQLPGDVFDTQIAWAMLGRGYQASYAALVEDRLGVVLDKSETRSRWDRRPLTPAQLRYALIDVLHLGPLYEELRAELEARGRLGWMREEMARLLRPATWTPDPERAWMAVRRKQPNFPAERLGALRELAAWRERVARRLDRARRRVADDELLLELAAEPPAARAAFDRRVRRRLRGATPDELWEALARAREAPGFRPESAGRAEQQRRREEVKRLTPLAQAAAAELGVARELLAPRQRLEELVRGAPEPLLLQGWRRDAVGARLAEALDAG